VGWTAEDAGIATSEKEDTRSIETIRRVA
jgi:hypothetical protein